MVLAAAALGLAAFTVLVLRHPAAAGAPFVSLILLIGLDLLLFILLGRYLIARRIVQPLTEVARVAATIAAGEYDRRVAPAGNHEMQALATAFNGLTDQLLRNQQLLQENVESLDRTNQALVEAQQELVQTEKLASIGRLAAGIAHEVGNPLGSVLGYASVLRRRNGDPEIVGGIEREARRIDRIVRGLLDYAKPGAAAHEMVDVNASVTRVLELLRVQGRLARVEVRLDLDDELPHIPGGAHALDQIFVNLFTNADDAMPDGGELRVTTRREWLEPAHSLPVRRASDPPGINYAHLRRSPGSMPRRAPRIDAGGEMIRILIADTGTGIPEELLETIFDPFVTTKPPGQGTGLGLAIVESAVAEMGGRIEASSGPEGGATFLLTLPVGGTEP